VPDEVGGAPAEAEPETPELEGPPHGIASLSVRPDAVEIDVDGRRLALPGYPAPRSEHHGARLTTVVFSPDREELAIAGDCRGAAGEDAPTCARAFVRVYRVADGSRVRDLKTPWPIGDEYERRVRAMAFDERGERLAVLLTASWADCMWEGERINLIVYRLADGKRLASRQLAADDTVDADALSFQGDEVHAAWRAGGQTKRQVVRL
jgi:hypothetical protein